MPDEPAPHPHGGHQPDEVSKPGEPASKADQVAEPEASSKASQSASKLSVAVPVAFEIGWTMALLYRLDPQPPPQIPGPPALPSRLPSGHELGGMPRLELERARLGALVQRLGGEGAPYAGTFTPDLGALAAWPRQAPGTPGGEASGGEVSAPGDTPAGGQGRQSAQPLSAVVEELNLSMLTALAKCGTEVESGYRIGRALRDTVVPAPVPPGQHVPGLRDSDSGPIRETLRMELSAFDPGRVALIQQWLAAAAANFPKNAAKVVSASLGRWAAFVSAALNLDTTGNLTATGSQRRRRTRFTNRHELANRITYDLRVQGDLWLDLLTGAQSTEGLLTPEGYVAAGEAALSRTLRIVVEVLRHYWLVAVAVLAGLGVVLGICVATETVAGAAKVWTAIAAAAAALGISWKGIGAAIPKLAAKGESPIMALEEVDAMAWSVTSLPAVQLNPEGVRALRRAGVSKSAPTGVT